VFNDVVAAYLQRLTSDDDGYVRLIRLSAYEIAEVVVDPARGFGQPIFARGGARLEDALALFRAGEPLDVVAGTRPRSATGRTAGASRWPRSQGTSASGTPKLGAASPILAFTNAEWTAFVAGVRNAEFDL
jgi:hypothetical protein